MMYGKNSHFVKALFVETGTYDEMPLRSWESQLDIDGLKMFQEATRGGTSISPSALGGVAGAVLRPSTMGLGNAQIAQGMGERRLRFMFEIRHESAMNFGDVVTQYLTGWTDYVGVIRKNGFGEQVPDPNMRLYFNNSVTTRTVREQTPGGIIERVGVSDASHILAGTYQPSFDQSGRVTHMMRPEDVFSTISLGVLGDTSNVLDTRTTFADEQIKKSRRSNGSAPKYLSGVLNAYQMAMSSDATNGVDLAGVMDEARGQVMEPLVAEDFTLSRLAQHTSLNAGNSMTYGELQAFDPSFDVAARFELNPPGAPSVDHQRGMTEHWNGQNSNTIASTMLMQSVPAIMADLMLLGVGFHATNATLDGSIYVQITEHLSFAQNLDLTPYLQMFQNRLINEVLRNLSFNNQIPFNVTYRTDLLGETRMSVSVNNEPMVPRCSPAFCDSLFPLVMTDNQQMVRSMASDIEQLAENLSTTHGQAVQTPQIQLGGFNGGYQSSI